MSHGFEIIEYIVRSLVLALYSYEENNLITASFH